MYNKNDFFKKIYLESIFNDEKDVTSPDPEKIQDNGDSIDDLTKENTVTIDEDSTDQDLSISNKSSEDGNNIEVTIQNEEPEINSKINNDVENIGWDESINEILSSIMEEGESLFYEIKNCAKGTYTNCKTKEELADYLAEYGQKIMNIANDISENNNSEIN